MILFLRFVGIINAAVWFGAAFFMLTTVLPAVYSQEMKGIFGQVYTGIIWQIILGRFFVLECWCGGVALVHLTMEWLLIGKAWRKGMFALAIAIFSVALINGAWLEPKLEQFYRTKYSTVARPVEKEVAGRYYRVWNRVSFGFHVMVVGGLMIFVCRMAGAPNGPRFVPANKFRG